MTKISPPPSAPRVFASSSFAPLIEGQASEAEKCLFKMEQNANESCVNVCAIQVQNRAGWLNVGDSLSCIMLTQNEHCKSCHHNDKQAQILKINTWIPCNHGS